MALDMPANLKQSHDIDATVHATPHYLLCLILQALGRPVVPEV